MTFEETIEPVLTSFEIPVGRVITDNTEYDYFIDNYEPSRVYAFEADTIENLRDKVDSQNPQSGILIAYVKNTDEVLACGVGQYRDLQETAFQPIEHYFH